MWLALLALLAIVPLGRELFSTRLVLSDQSTDVALHFLFSRAFGFGEMAHGNLPLWNPYIYGGIPYLGEFQSALLYPLNLIFLVLPLATAINWSFGLHVYLLGLAMYFWARQRGLLRPAAFIAGVTSMLGGAFYLHIYAGHLSNVCAMAWAPLVFLGIDAWLKRRHAGWIFLAAAAAAMQVYAGHPQYVYYTALTAGCYSLIYLIGIERPVNAALGLLAIYPLAVLLSAAQLLPSLSATAETIRSGGVNYEFASMFSFPPENLLTLLMPSLFGNMQSIPYWGRCYLWEMSLYAGCAATVLAIYGALKPTERQGRARLLVFLGIVIVLALGAHTPVHHVLFSFLPGFSSFRGSSKFMFFAALVIALLAGMGFDRLLRSEKPSLKFCLVGIGAGVLLLLTGLFIVSVTPESFLKIVSWEFSTHESYLNPVYFQNAAGVDKFKQLGANSLLLCGGLLVTSAGLMLAARRHSAATYFLGALCLVELLVYASSSVISFPLEKLTYPSVADFLKKNPGDYRTLNLFNPDASMFLRTEGIWGYDPAVLKRYAQLVNLSQGVDPEAAQQSVQFSKPHPILNLLRCRYAFVQKEDGQIGVVPMGEAFPHFYLVSKYEVYPSAKAVFHELELSSYGLKDKVLLEQEPIPRPSQELGNSEIKVLGSSTNSWTLEIKTDHAAILVMTDSYSNGWHAVALSGSTQQHYDVLPANGAVRAVPLAAGHHLIRFSYIPQFLYLGIATTLASMAFVVLCFLLPSLQMRLSFNS